MAFIATERRNDRCINGYTEAQAAWFVEFSNQHQCKEMEVVRHTHSSTLPHSMPRKTTHPPLTNYNADFLQNRGFAEKAKMVGLERGCKHLVKMFPVVNILSRCFHTRVAWLFFFFFHPPADGVGK